METNKRRGAYDALGVDCYSQCPRLPAGLGLVHRLQPGGWHRPGGLAVCSWLPSVRKHLFHQIPHSSPHSFSFLVCTLTASFPTFLWAQKYLEGGRAARWTGQTVTWRILKSAEVSGRQMEAVLSGWRCSDLHINIVQSVLVGPTMATRQWKTLSDGGAGQGEEPQYK